MKPVRVLKGAARGALSLLRRFRARCPDWLNDVVTWLRWRLPQRWVDRVRGRPIAGARAVVETPPPPVRATAVTRLFIGPANFAGQGYRWARAVESALGVEAVAATFLDDRGLNFPTDYRVRAERWARDRRWQRASFEYISSSFSHVLLEAARPIFGSMHGFDPVADLDALAAQGVRGGMIAHGTDARLPDRHADRHRWSPFADTTWDELPLLQRNAEIALRRYGDFNDAVFVSTPDLLEDLPDARWCPVVVESAAWAVDLPAFQSETVVVVHAPSRSRIKGTAAVEAAIARLDDVPQMQFRRIQGIPADQMPGTYGAADVILDQFALGSYGVAACEGMAAGRLVIGHVSPFVRETAAEAAGMELPILEATPESLSEVLRDVVARPSAYQVMAAAGPKFVTQLHDGRRSATVLGQWLDEPA